MISRRVIEKPDGTYALAAFRDGGVQMCCSCTHRTQEEAENCPVAVSRMAQLSSEFDRLVRPADLRKVV
jgi:hypothetical protein